MSSHTAPTLSDVRDGGSVTFAGDVASVHFYAATFGHAFVDVVHLGRPEGERYATLVAGDADDEAPLSALIQGW